MCKAIALVIKTVIFIINFGGNILLKVTGYVLLINIHENKKYFIPTNSYTSRVYSQPNDNRGKH